MGEWFVGLGYEVQLATWLVASLMLYILASQVVWHSQWVFDSASSQVRALSPYLVAERHRPRDDRLGRLIDRARDHPLVPWAEEAVRFIYYLGIPFVALINGWLGADVLGISGTDWVDGKSAQGFLWEDWAKGFGLATATVLAVAGVWYAGRLFSRKAKLAPIAPDRSGPLWRRLVDALYLQIHWAFYRGGPILWVNDLYWGTFIGLAIVLIEFGFNPAFGWSLKSPETAGPPFFRLAMAWISAFLFLATRNLWLLAGAHLALTVLLGGTVTNDHGYVDESTP